jgi:hypothetical protein
MATDAFFVRREAAVLARAFNESMCSRAVDRELLHPPSRSLTGAATTRVLCHARREVARYERTTGLEIDGCVLGVAEGPSR